MSNAATGADLKAAVRTMTMRFAVAAVLIVVAGGAMIGSR